jgi:hypothetical protein
MDGRMEIWDFFFFLGSFGARVLCEELLFSEEKVCLFLIFSLFISYGIWSTCPP